MKNRATIIFFFMVLFIFNCSHITLVEKISIIFDTRTEYSTNTNYQSFTSTNELLSTVINTQTASKTITSSRTATPTIEVKDLRYIFPSTILDDNRIWAMSAIKYEEGICEFQSGSFYLSEHNGIYWKYIAPPFHISLSSCMNNDFIEERSKIIIVPYKKGIIIQLMLGGTALPSQNPIYYWNGIEWNPILPPLRGYYDDFDSESYGLSQMIITPDGRIIAVGVDPDGISNTWMLESPGAPWRDISFNIPEDNFFTNIIWSYRFGLVGLMRKTSSIYRLNDDSQWINIGYPEKNLTLLMWMGLNGEVCTWKGAADDAPKLGWDGTQWKLYEQASNCSFGTKFIAYNKFSIVKRYEPEETWVKYIINDNQFQKLTFPESSRSEIIDLAVSQTGVIYVLYEDGLYASMNIGETWWLNYGY